MPMERIVRLQIADTYFYYPQNCGISENSRLAA
jgi:hypothetical protein